jgi:hypothetical protein
MDGFFSLKGSHSIDLHAELESRYGLAAFAILTLEK